MVKKSIVLAVVLTLGLIFFSWTSLSLAAEKGLVGYWKFDEGKGTIAKDSSGKGNDGTLHGPVWVKDGLEFDGKDDYIFIPASESLNITEEITILAWIKQPSMSDNRFYNVIITKRDIWFFGTRGGDKVHFYVYPHHHTDKYGTKWNIVCISRGNCLKAGTLNQIAGTFSSEAGMVKIYANGECLKYRGGDDTPTPEPGWFSIGNYPGHGNSFFQGIIKEVKIYNRVLSAEEIREQYKEQAEIIF